MRGGSGPALRRQPGGRFPDRIDVTPAPISRVLAVLSGELWDRVNGNSLGGIGLCAGRERPAPARRVPAPAPIAGAAAGAERTAGAGRGLRRAVAAGDAVEGDDAGPAVQPVGRLARLFRACRACRFPRRLGPAELPADGARLPSARAHALRLPGQRGVHGRGPVRGVVPGRDAAPAAAAGRPLRGVYKPARPDAGECRGPTRAIHLRDVLQSLRLERLQHPGADPVRAAARGPGSQGRRLDRHRRRRRPSGGDVLLQDHLLRRGPRHAWALPCCSIRMSAATGGRGSRSAPCWSSMRWRRTIGRTWPTSWAGRRAAPCARRRPCTSTTSSRRSTSMGRISPPSRWACGCGGREGRRSACR